MNKSLLCLIIIVLVLASCSTARRKEQRALRTYVSQGNYQKALDLVENSKVYKDKDSRLLYFLEKGLLLHASGKIYQSILIFEQAKDLSRKLYTISLSKKSQTLIANDQFDIYYGAKYERSMINFYLALNHFLLYQKGSYAAYTEGKGKKEKKFPAKKLTAQERRRELMAARAEVLDWDSYLTTLRNERKGRSVFKNSLMAKMLGGYIHEAIGTRNDEQIALQLYKDAKILLFRNFNGYRSFNLKSVMFKKDFDKLPKMKREKVEAQYIKKTSFQRGLINFLDYKILALTNRIRPNEFTRIVQLEKPAPEIIKRVKSEKRQSHNVAIIFQRGLIPQKIADKQYFGLAAAISGPNASKGSKAAAKIGAQVLTHFAVAQLGLSPAPKNWSPAGAALGVGVAAVAVTNAAISFELPKIDNKPVNEKILLEVFDHKGKKFLERKIDLITPLGDIAEEAIAEDSGSRYLRLGARLAGKHLVAILASYGTYKLMEPRSGKFFAKSAAVLQYIGVSKGIEASERADIRFWSTLPYDLRMTHIFLPKGKYHIKAKQMSPSKEAKYYDLGWINIQNTKRKKLISFRSPR